MIDSTVLFSMGEVIQLQNIQSFEGIYLTKRYMHDRIPRRYLFWLDQIQLHVTNN